MSTKPKTLPTLVEEEAQSSLPATTEHAGLPDYIGADDPSGVDTISTAEAMLPRLDLVQPVSDSVTEHSATPGKLRLNITGQQFDSLDVMIVAITKGRILFQDKTPLCRSFDGIVSDPKLPSRIQESCAGCIKSTWSDGKAPECSETYNVFMVDITDPAAEGYGTPFWFTARKSSLKPFREQVITPIMMRKPGIAYAWKFRLSTKLQKGEQGNYYIPAFSLLGFVSKDEYFSAKNSYYPLSQQMSFRETVQAEEAAKSANAAPAPAGQMPDDDIPF